MAASRDSVEPPITTKGSSGRGGTMITRRERILDEGFLVGLAGAVAVSFFLSRWPSHVTRDAAH
jgi:hypothetical protein